MNLNVGCGHNPIEDWINLDINPETGCDVVAALPPIPFRDATIDHILASHFIEHIATEKKIELFNEFWRVLKPGGLLEIYVPYAMKWPAIADPTHCCYSNDTEILTFDGWKSIKDTVLGEYVLTVDPITKMAEYQPITQLHEYAYDGDLVWFHTDCMDLLVTPNHNMVSYRPYKSMTKYQLREAASFVDRYDRSRGFPQLVEMAYNQPIPHTITIPDLAPRQKTSGGWKPILEYPTIPFMKLIGWFISEGYTSITPANSAYKVCISQSWTANEEKCQMIMETIRALGESPRKIENGIEFTNKSLAYYLVTWGNRYTKRIPVWIKQQNPEILNALLETALLGDGSLNGTTSQIYGSVCYGLASDIAEIAQKCGYRATQSIEKRSNYKMMPSGQISYCQDINLVYISTRTTLYTHDAPTMIPYVGNIVSVGVEKYHTIYVRRNGRAMWSGNSLWVPESGNYFKEEMAYLKYGIKVWSKSDWQLNDWVIEAKMIK